MLQNLCNAEHNPVLASLATLTAGLIVPNASPMFSLLVLLVGPIDEWAPELKRNAFQATLRTAGHLWRRLFAYFQDFPWKASWIVDNRVPRQRRREIVQEVIRLQSCCGDDEFILRLQEMMAGLSEEELEQLLDATPDIGQMLLGIFVSVLETSSHIEDSFAHLRKFIIQCGRASSAANLSAFHLLKELKRAWAHAKWMHDHPDQDERRRLNKSKQKKKKKKQYPPRPVWAKAKNKRLGGSSYRKAWTTFMHRHRRKNGGTGQMQTGEVCAAAAAWRQLPEASKVQAERESRAGSIALRYSSDPLDNVLEKAEEADSSMSWTPWSMGSLVSPLSCEALDPKDRPGGGQPRASWAEDWSAHWRAMSNEMVMPDETFPKSVAHKRTCGKANGVCEKELINNGMLNTMEDLLLYMRYALLPPNKTKAQADKDAMLLGITLPDARCHVFAVCSSFLASPANFSAEFVLCSGPEYNDDGLAPPFSVKLKFEADFGKDVLDSKREIDLASLLIELAGQEGLPRPLRFRWHRLEYTLDDLQTLDVERMEHLDLAALVEQEKAARLEQLKQKRRQDLLKRAMGLARPKRKRAAGTVREKVPRHMQGRKRRKIVVEDGQDVIFQDDGESQDEALSADSGEEVWVDIQDDDGNADDEDHDVILQPVPGAEHKFTATIDGKPVGRIQYTNVSDAAPMQGSMHVSCLQGHGSKCRIWKTFLQDRDHFREGQAVAGGRALVRREQVP